MKKGRQSSNLRPRTLDQAISMTKSILDTGVGNDIWEMLALVQGESREQALTSERIASKSFSGLPSANSMIDSYMEFLNSVDLRQYQMDQRRHRIGAGLLDSVMATLTGTSTEMAKVNRIAEPSEIQRQYTDLMASIRSKKNAADVKRK